MRNDSSLSTGASSASFATPKGEEVIQRRQEEKEQKQERRNKLSPAAEVVIEEIDKELVEVSNINYLEIESMLTDEHFKSEMMARKKYVVYLTGLKNKMNNILRESK